MRNARHSSIFSTTRGSSVFVAVATVAFSIVAIHPSYGSVEVDLSVLDDNGASTAVSTGDLRMPGRDYPKSEYFGPPVEVTVPMPTPAPKPEPKTDNMAAPEVAPEPDTVPEPETATVPEPPAPEVATAPEPESQSEAVETSATEDAPPPPPEPASLEVSPTPTSETAEADASTGEEKESGTESTASTETASTGSQETAAMRIVFTGEDTRLPEGANATLDPVAAEASADDNIRIQLRAYAGGEDISASKARRLSLSRALAVRSYLIEQGVRSTRIDVRALGDKVDDEPINRVDIDVGAR